MIDVVIEYDSKRELVPMRWGRVPSWWNKKAKETPSTFNARAETVAEKPMFRSAFKRNRCLIPASGHCSQRILTTGWLVLPEPNCSSQRPTTICKRGRY